MMQQVRTIFRKPVGSHFPIIGKWEAAFSDHRKTLKIRGWFLP